MKRLVVAMLLAVVSWGGAKPNVILILADDLGYETIGANGGSSYKTPVLDSLAAQGARFTHGYAQPLCTPSRVQLMTGLSNVRNYINFGNMDRKAITFGNHLQKAGYATCMAGKWQLGHDLDQPNAYGFEEYCLWQHTRRPPRYANPGLEINGVLKDYGKGEYGPDLVSDYVLDFITRKKAQPFFVYYPMMLTHDPYQPTPDSKDWNPKATGEKGNQSPAHFSDMVAYMDKLVGKLVIRLEEQGLRENTLILFLGDNGTGAGTRSMMGQTLVTGKKGSALDAGMHVPVIVNWPGKIAKGTVCADLVDTTDFLPTICDAAGIKGEAIGKLDGRSFYPQLRGEKGNPRQWIYSWYSPRQGNSMKVTEFTFDQRFKLYRDGRFFDRSKDSEEKNPLAIGELKGSAADAAKLLQSALDHFNNARPKKLKP